MTPDKFSSDPFTVLSIFSKGFAQMSLKSKSFLPSLAILFGIIATFGCEGSSGQPSATNKPASVVEKNVEQVKAPEVAPCRSWLKLSLVQWFR
jgi:hypothetical protein